MPIYMDTFWFLVIILEARNVVIVHQIFWYGMTVFCYFYILRDDRILNTLVFQKVFKILVINKTTKVVQYSEALTITDCQFISILI